MKRRDVLKAALAAPLPAMAAPPPAAPAAAGAAAPGTMTPRTRVRPGDADWPAAGRWQQLSQAVDGRLLALASPFAHCDADACAATLRELHNPFYVGDQPALTQTSGWIDGWRSQPSAYAVAAESATDVAAAVDFAREHRLRLVVKGGGHSYQGTSDAPDSLLVWTRRMNQVQLHDAFVPQGGAGRIAPQPAVSIGAGAMWTDAYDAVTTRGGRYVQGGGCTSVGVAGLVQSGGFGNFSKCYGTAAAHLLEAEVVTADGRVRIVNAVTHPDLFWALKGGGGGSFGVVTRLTLRTHELPPEFGGVFGAIEADDDASYKALIAQVIALCQRELVSPHWGEQIVLEGEKTLRLSLVFQGLTQAQAEAVWTPLREWVQAHPACRFTQPLHVLTLPARHFWDAAFLREHLSGLMQSDARSGAPAHHAWWSGDSGQVGWFIHGYRSAWLPTSLLQPHKQAQLVDALFEGKRHWDVALHLNKGLAGAPAEQLAAARDTATNPQVLDAFALAICAGGGAPAYPGQPGARVDELKARRDAATIGRAIAPLLQLVPDAGSYVSESDYFERDWQRAFWGANHARLQQVKQRYDPHGLFFVRHGVGSEAWSDDGFTPRT